MERIFDQQVGRSLRVTVVDIRWWPAGFTGFTHPYHVVLWRTNSPTWRDRVFHHGRGQAREALWDQRFITRAQAMVQARWLVADPDHFIMEAQL